MAQSKVTSNVRLMQIKDFLTFQKTATTLPWDPNSTKFPTRKELPEIPGAPAEAAWVWGENDYVCWGLGPSMPQQLTREQIGRLNLLTPTRVAEASREIRTGEVVPVK